MHHSEEHCGVHTTYISQPPRYVQYWQQRQHKLRLSEHFPTWQPAVDAAARQQMVDAYGFVAHHLNLKDECLHTSVQILDRALSGDRVVPAHAVRAVCVATFFIAVKICEPRPVRLVDILTTLNIPAQLASQQAVLRAEKFLLLTLGFDLSFPTPLQFAMTWLREVGLHRQLALVNTIKYMLELGLLHIRLLQFSPSILAGAAIANAFEILRLQPTDLLFCWHATEELATCQQALRTIWLDATNTPISAVVFSKYAQPERQWVAIRAQAEAHNHQEQLV